VTARKKAAQLGQKSLSKIFNSYAKKAVKDFPQLKGRLAILDVKAHDYHGEVDLEKSGFASDADFVRYLSNASQDAEKKATSKAKRQGDFLLIVFNGAMKATGLHRRDVIKTLDHELGHLVVPDAFGGRNTNFKECVADVFSCLRHIQRFSTDSNIIDRLAWKRAIHFVRYGEAGHFTSFALEALKPLQGKIDFNALTPQQMTELSWNIAAKFSLSESLAGRLKENFKSVKSKMSADLAAEAKMKLVADLICGDVDYYTFKAGLAFLKPYFETGTGFKGKKLYLGGSYWDSVQKTLKEKELKLAETGLFFNMPLARNNVIKFPNPKP
jgi:hypothetical protein